MRGLESIPDTCRVFYIIFKGEGGRQCREEEMGRRCGCPFYNVGQEKIKYSSLSTIAVLCYSKLRLESSSGSYSEVQRESKSEMGATFIV